MQPDLRARPGLPTPPESVDQAQRRQLADRLPRADSGSSLIELKERSQKLLPGHPSSPWNADGSLRPPEKPLTDYELPETHLSDADYAAHIKEVTERLDQARADGLTTDALHTVNPDHDIWSDERTACHDEILNELYAAAAEVPNERRAVMAGGLGGAGKTTVLEQHAGIDRSKYLTINPDQFKEILAEHGLLPQVAGLSPMEATALAHKESSYLARRLALRAIADGKNVIWDITMSSTETTSGRIDELRNAGYERIDAVFVDIPIDTSVARAAARHRDGHDRYLAGHGFGGRFVPPDIIRSQADPEYGSINRRAFETLKDRFTAWARYDNSVDGRRPVLIEQSGQDAQTVPGDRYKESRR